MRRIQPLIKEDSSSSPPPVNSPSSNYESSSTVFFARNIVIVIAVMFFICGLLHLLVRYLMKRKRSSPSSSSNPGHQSSRFQESVNGDDVTYERQLQQLFNLHDSGLDQAFIDALPLFPYKELMGLKEPFDCAVCLCEFTEQDKLRLLPLCSHAFHIHCIDTWLLSNSTCPLCRGTLFSPGFSVENPIFDFGFDDSREEEDGDYGFSNSGSNTIHVGVSGNFKQSEGSIGNEKKVYPVKLGKFRATNGGKKEDKEELGETSNSNFDARRCYSMGSYQYVVANSDLQVAFCPNRGSSMRGIMGNKDVLRVEKDKGNSSIDEGSDGKKITKRSKGESFSVSKIWLWSKKDHHKFQNSTGTHMVNSSVNVSLPFRNTNTCQNV